MDFGSFVLAAATADLAEEPYAREHADAVEFRMDLADDPLDQLDGYEGALPLVVTNRVEAEGGEAPDDERRVETLLDAMAYPAVEAVDVELAAVREGPRADRLDGERVLDRAAELDVATIVSAHDFDGMPGRDGIRRALMRAGDLGDVAKFAGTAGSRGDALDLLAVTHEREAAGEVVATMAMGEAGRHTRAVAPLYGSRVGYAPVDPARVTAPGQYDLATLRELVERLRSRGARTED